MNQKLSFFPRIELLFASSSTGENPYAEEVRRIIRRMFPQFPSEEASADPKQRQVFYKEFQRKLPLLAWSALETPPCQVSFFLCCRFRPNAFRFFYEMVSRWLVPGKRLNALLQFAVDFRLPDFSDETYICGQVMLEVETHQELLTLQKHLPIIESEIRLGIESLYQASRILEIKGLSADEKTAMIQENIASLVKHRPQDFDYDVFAEMQHFLVMCKDEFKAIREYRHMSRIIYVHYLFRRALKHSYEAFPERRYLSLKLVRARLHTFPQKKIVLGVLVGMSFLKENEHFEERHIVSAIRNFIPEVQVVPGSFFVNKNRSEPMQTFYLEVEKSDGTLFSLDETALLRAELPNELKNHIEKRHNSIFMPQNEEEIMRHVLVLSNELRFPRDLPQAVITFQGQTEANLLFSVIIVRVRREQMMPLETLFARPKSSFKIVLERTKQMGWMRKRYQKEACIFRIEVDKDSFLRQDHSVDLYQARQAIVIELTRILGEFRDYNGGMIAKQTEVLASLTEMLGPVAKEHAFLLQNFFYSLTPSVMRNVLAPHVLKTLFLVLLEGVSMGITPGESYLYTIHEEKEMRYLFLLAEEPSFKDLVMSAVDQVRFYSRMLAFSFVPYGDFFCLALCFQSSDNKEFVHIKAAIEEAMLLWQREERSTVRLGI